MTMINNDYTSSWGAIEDFTSYGVDAPMAVVAEPVSPADIPVVDAYGIALPSTDDDTTMVVLPTNEPSAQPELSSINPDAAANAQALVDQLNAPGFTPANNETAQQASGALQQLLAAHTPETAEQLAPALAYWSDVAANAVATGTTVEATNEAFDPNGNFEYTPDNTPYDTIVENAVADLEAMANGPDGIDAADVGAMQGALAESMYAMAIDAQFAGNSAGAHDAANMALSYIASMEAAGIDVSEYSALIDDLKVFSELDVLNISYVAPNAIVQPGQVVVGTSDGAVTLDAWDIAFLLDTERPPLTNPDPTTDPGYDGTGLDLGPDPSTETAPESGGYDGSFGDTGSLDGPVESGGYDGSFGDTGSFDGGSFESGGYDGSTGDVGFGGGSGGGGKLFHNLEE